MRRRKTEERFNNNEQMGFFTDIFFEISHETNLGPESIKFETKIHYLDKGEGEILLLVHGIGQSLYTWHKSINFFVKHGYRVLAFDMAGFGYSGHPHIDYTVEENTLIIEAFLNSLKIKKVNIIAFSTSCLSAICFVKSQPERVGKLVLISPGGPNEDYPFSLKFLTTWLGHAISRLLITEASIHSILRSLCFDATIITSDVVKEYYAPYHNKDVRNTLAMSITHFDDTYPRSLLKGTKQKTLIFSGADDKIHNEERIKPYTITMPNAKHIRVRNCSHFVHEEKPKKFNEETLAFLKKKNKESY